MTKGTLFANDVTGKSWWRGACAGVPAWRWPSSL
jgi:hypothetical protein